MYCNHNTYANGTPCKIPKLEAFGNISDENKENNSPHTSRCMGIQCNTYVKCFISVEVQTDVSALDTTTISDKKTWDTSNKYIFVIKCYILTS